MYKFIYTPFETKVEPALSEDIINKIFKYQSVSFTRFDEVSRRKVKYPIRKVIDWNFYKDDKFPSGFLSDVIQQLEGVDSFNIESPNFGIPSKEFQLESEFVNFLFQRNINLRYFQEEPVELIKEFGNGVIEIGTGGGKTIFYGNLVQSLGVKTLILTIDLASKDQTYKELIDMFGETNVATIDMKDYYEYPIVVANIQNCWAKLKKIDSCYISFCSQIKLLIVNEAHHVNESMGKQGLANTWYNVVMNIPAWYRVGATGTIPKEGSLGRALLTGGIGPVIYSKPTTELIKEGFATPIEVHVYTKQSDNQEHTQSIQAYKNMVEDSDFIPWIAAIALKYVNEGKKIGIFCDWVELQTLALEKILGSLCRVVHGGNKGLRESIFDSYKRNNFPILIGTVFSEDINIPAMDVGIILGNKKNEKKINQRVGRIARLFEGKDKGIFVIPFLQDYKQQLKNGKLKKVNGILAKHSEEGIRILEKQGYEIIYKEL